MGELNRMSKLNELIQFADHIGQGKKEERRYQDQRNMQLAQISEQKNQKKKIIQSQQFLNQAVKSFSNSGWNEDGTYSNNSPNQQEVIDGYLNNMDSIGQAGDRHMLTQQLMQVNSQTLMQDANKLTGKVAQWEAAHADEKDDWFGSYDEDRKAYLKQIGADKLYANLHGLGGGPAKAMELTGLAPDSFNKEDQSWTAWAKENKLLTGGGLIASGVALRYGGPKVAKAVQGIFKSISKGDVVAPEKIRQLLPHIKDSNARGVMNKILKLQNAGDNKGAIKLLNRFNKKFPQLNVIDDIVKGVKPQMAPPKTTGGLIIAAKNLFTGDKGSVVKALKSSGYAKYGLGMVAGGAVASKIAEWMGADEGTQGLVSAGGTITGAITAPKVMKAMTSPAFLKILKRHAPKIATKLAISAAGYVGPQAAEPISTALGLAGSAWAAYDIYQLTKSIPELASYFKE